MFITDLMIEANKSGIEMAPQQLATHLDKLFDDNCVFYEVLSHAESKYRYIVSIELKDSHELSSFITHFNQVQDDFSIVKVKEYQYAPNVYINELSLGIFKKKELFFKELLNDQLGSIEIPSLESLLKVAGSKAFEAYKDKRYSDSLSSFKESLLLMLRKGKNINTDLEIATCLYNMGSAYLLLSNSQSAEFCLLRAVEIIQSSDDADVKTKIKYAGKLVQSLINQEKYGDTTQDYLTIIFKHEQDAESKNIFLPEEIRQIILNARENEKKCNKYWADFGEDIDKENPYGFQKYVDGSTDYRDKKFVVNVEEKKYSEKRMILAAFDPAKEQQAINDARAAIKKDNQWQAARIIFCFPLQKREETIALLEAENLSVEFKEMLCLKAPSEEETEFYECPVDVSMTVSVAPQENFEEIIAQTHNIKKGKASISKLPHESSRNTKELPKIDAPLPIDIKKQHLTRLIIRARDTNLWGLSAFVKDLFNIYGNIRNLDSKSDNNFGIHRLELYTIEEYLKFHPLKLLGNGPLFSFFRENQSIHFIVEIISTHKLPSVDLNNIFLKSSIATFIGMQEESEKEISFYENDFVLALNLGFTSSHMPHLESLRTELLKSQINQGVEKYNLIVGFNARASFDDTEIIKNALFCGAIAFKSQLKEMEISESHYYAVVYLPSNINILSYAALVNSSQPYVTVLNYQECKDTEEDNTSWVPISDESASPSDTLECQQPVDLYPDLKSNPYGHENFSGIQGANGALVSRYIYKVGGIEEPREVRLVALKPPAHEKFEAVKKLILKVVSDGQYEKFRRILRAHTSEQRQQIFVYLRQNGYSEDKIKVFVGTNPIKHFDTKDEYNRANRFEQLLASPHEMMIQRSKIRPSEHTDTRPIFSTISVAEMSFHRDGNRWAPNPGSRLSNSGSRS